MVRLAHFPFRVLRSLKLEKAYCSASDLSTLFITNGATLRSIYMRDCMLPHLDDWRKLLLRINDSEAISLDVLGLHDVMTLDGCVRLGAGQCVDCYGSTAGYVCACEHHYLCKPQHRRGDQSPSEDDIPVKGRGKLSSVRS